MKETLRVYNISFRGHWPVPNGLVLAAYNEDQAKKMATDLLEEENLDPETIDIFEVILEEPTIIFFENGGY